MKKIFNAAFLYLILGLGAGVFYREFTKLNDFPAGQFTQLGVAHTHLLTLGFLVLLVVLVIDKVFVISRSRRLFGWFFWLYNVGVVITSAMLIWHGSLTVLGQESNAMFAGIAGLGHIAISAALVIFSIALGRAVNESAATRSKSESVQS
ncbi:DUF2871 domain-containing protein [uncultured Gulosibacter sp.]|uniref:DUF2871 domain-containing protein n=1 Tax=uncultured Gulosibacter sp. TaxID=1339167 RepID=UPI00288BED31|nr:DUF2871 domain-containing protein [uncultured Gulosibacter sp.]